MNLTPKQIAILQQAAWEEGASQVRDQIISRIEDPLIINTYLRYGLDILEDGRYDLVIITYRLKFNATFSLDEGPIKPLIDQLEKLQKSDFYSWVYEDEVEAWLKFLKSL